MKDRLVFTFCHALLPMLLVSTVQFLVIGIRDIGNIKIVNSWIAFLVGWDNEPKWESQDDFIIKIDATIFCSSLLQV